MMGAMTTHEAPLTHGATVTHVMSEADTERVFPWDHEGPHTGAKQCDYGRAIPPSVKWIVRAEPLACSTCGGVGSFPWQVHTEYGYQTVDDCCLDCNGAGLPTVQIVSDQQINGKPMMEPEVHCTVTIGAAMQILYDVEGVCTNPHHLFHNWERIGGIRRDLVIECIDAQTDDITDQFGDQAVTPGMWAHPILT